MKFITVTLVRPKSKHWVPPLGGDEVEEKLIHISADHMLSIMEAPKAMGGIIAAIVTMPVGEMMVRETVEQLRLKIAEAIRREAMYAAMRPDNQL